MIQKFSEPNNKVVVNFIGGTLAKGYINFLDSSKQVFDMKELDSNGEKTFRKVRFADIKAVFFVRDFDRNPLDVRVESTLDANDSDENSDGVVAIRLLDGEVLDGRMREASDDPGGIFLDPKDPTDNNIHVFIPHTSVTGIQVGRKLGETLVQEGMITSQELGVALDRQREFREKRLGEIFLEKRIISFEELQKGLNAQKKQVDMKIGDVLVQTGVITPGQLEIALGLQKKNRGKRLGEILIGMNLINEEMVALALALRYRLPYVDLNTYPVDPLAVNSVPSKLAREFNIFPIEIRQNELAVAIADPLNLGARDYLSFHTGLRIREVIASPDGITKAVKEHYDTTVNENWETLLADNLDVEEIKISEEEGYDILKKMGEEKPIIALVNHILKTAVDKKASDVHIVPEAKQVKVCLRIDGVLHEERTLSIDLLPPLSSRMKILAGMNIAERRLPQDGRAKIRIGDKVVDLRFSCMPTVYGESTVVRVLDKGSAPIELKGMGFLGDDLEGLERCIARPHGMILITGPTGSGKSSTIYACLKEPVFTQKNIVTLEDPVEFELPGVNQVQIRSNIGFTFARGLRQILRHDPDVIMVGEMRDAETARIGVQAALTGHLLISTLHTNNAAEAYVRLVDMGVEPYLVSATIICVLSQRLIRRICPDCKEVDPQGAERLKMSSFPVESYEDITFHEGRGCDKCNNTGYRGRTIAYEFLLMHEDIKRAVVKGESSLALRSLAIKKGMKTIEETAFHKAKEGVTSVEEVLCLAAE